MTQKQQPKVFRMPPPPKGLVAMWTAIGKILESFFRKIKDDSDNGVTTFPHTTIAGIANVSLADFDNGQIRFYTDSDDADKVYLVARVEDALKKEELT